MRNKPQYNPGDALFIAAKLKAEVMFGEKRSVVENRQRKFRLESAAKARRIRKAEALRPAEPVHRHGSISPQAPSIWQRAAAFLATLLTLRRTL